MSNKQFFSFTGLWAAVVNALLLVVGCSFGNVFATDLTMEQYEDSVAAAQKAEKVAANLPTPAPITEKQEPLKVLNALERAVIDSFDLAYRQYEMQWNEVKRLRDVVLVKDRIDALSFYLHKAIMTKTDVEKMTLILQSEKQTEREGTLFLIAHQSGKEQIKAHAHLIKLRSDISAIENFLYALHDTIVSVAK
jgi:hypothetical protein